jgi:hypothetical protein
MNEKSEKRGGSPSMDPNPKDPKPEDLVFRYNRAARLARASADAQWLEARRDGKRPGFFKLMFATRASRLLFATVLGVALFFLGSPLISRQDTSSGQLGSSRYSAEARYYEGRILIVVARSPVSGQRDPAQDGVANELVITASASPGPSVTVIFPKGEDGKNDYRLALSRASVKPEHVSIRIQEGSVGLDLVAEVE